MKKIALILFVCCMVVFLAPQAQAQMAIIWDWSFDEPNSITNGVDTIVMNATLHNSIDSTSNILRSHFSSSSYNQGSFDGLYSFSWGPSDNDLWSQFDPIDLAPGESFPFVFFRLTPISAPVAPGTVMNGSANLRVAGVNKGYYPFQVAVDEGNVVPEPATMVLFGTGLIGLAASRKRKV